MIMNYEMTPNKRIVQFINITTIWMLNTSVCFYVQIYVDTLREESSQTNVILQYKLLPGILSTVCSVIQQS